MSSDSSQVYVRSFQRRFLRVALVVAAILVLVATPLLINGSWRLDLAYRFGLAPGADVERIAEANSGITLIVIPIMVEINASRFETRFHAAYLSKSVGASSELTSLDNGSTVTVPLGQLDFIAADPTGEHLLLVEEGGLDSKRVLLTVATGSVHELPADQAEPNIPGDWSTSIYAARIGRTCQGISPQQTFIACFKSPTLAKFLAGDWQIDVRKYGEYRLNKQIFRGEGTQPVFGFTADESWLYFQNENGIWREPMSLDMLIQ
jgi:hypothetical protein